MQRLFLITTLLTAAACAEDSDGFGVGLEWRIELSGRAAPPGAGAENTVIVATATPPGEILTVAELNGMAVRGPFTTFATQHSPVAVGADLFLVTIAGRIEHLDLSGQNLPAPNLALGVPIPLVVGPDAILRTGSTTGRALGFRADGSVVFDTMLGGEMNTAPAVDAEGRTYFGLTNGTVIGLDALGNTFVQWTVTAPASGVSVSAAGQLAAGTGNSVATFDLTTQMPIFTHARPARVVGTRWLANGQLLAWGEDGLVELLQPDGTVVFTYDAQAPVYAPVVPVQDGFGIIDNDGIAHRIGAAGQLDRTLDLGGTPSREVAVTSSGWVAAAVGDEIIAVNFTFPR